MDQPAERWRELLSAPDEAGLPLDEPALLIAAHARADLDVAAELSRLDSLVEEIAEPSVAGLCTLAFGRLGLRGDEEHYDDPRNSYLDAVLDRRRGIPISLSVLLIELGRRCGVQLEGVGLPGRYLLRDPSDPEHYIDAFDGGRILNHDGCAELIRRLHGPGAQLNDEMLATTGRRATLTRMLSNLHSSFVRRADRRSLLSVTRLRAAIPGLSLETRSSIAELLADLGALRDAADLFGELAELRGLKPDVRRHLFRRSEGLRATLN